MALVNVELSTTRLTQRLAQFLATVMQETDRIVAAEAKEVKTETQRTWPVDSRASQAGWTEPQQVAPLTYQFSNPFIYAPIIEYGGYPHPGAKTATFSGTTLLGEIVIGPGIFPRQVPQAPLRRALARSYGQMTQQIGAILQQHWGK